MQYSVIAQQKWLHKWRISQYLLGLRWVPKCKSRSRNFTMSVSFSYSESSPSWARTERRMGKVWFITQRKRWNSSSHMHSKHTSDRVEPGPQSPHWGLFEQMSSTIFCLQRLKLWRCRDSSETQQSRWVALSKYGTRDGGGVGKFTARARTFTSHPSLTVFTVWEFSDWVVFRTVFISGHYVRQISAHLTPYGPLRVLHLLPAQPFHTHVVGVRSVGVGLGQRRWVTWWGQGWRRRRRRLGDKREKKHSRVTRRILMYCTQCTRHDVSVDAGLQKTEAEAL